MEYENKRGCMIYILILLFNLLFGGWSVNLILGWFGKNIPFIWDVVIGMFVAELSVPVAIVGGILKMCGVF